MTNSDLLDMHDLINICSTVIASFDYDQGKAFENTYGEMEEDEAREMQEGAARTLARCLPAGVVDPLVLGVEALEVETITLPADEAYDKVFKTEEWPVVERSVVGVSRWSVHYVALVHIPSDPEGIRRQVFFSRGATEYQDERAWEYDSEVTFTPVIQRQVLTEKWVECE